MNKKRIRFFPGITAIISGAVTAVIGIVMNAVLIPAIEANTGGIRCFDMNFAYSPETARAFLRSIRDEGRYIYLHRQLPLDFVYPVFYTLLFVSLIFLLCKSKKLLPALLVLPSALALLDYAENNMSIIMLKNGIPSDSFAVIASCVTSAKTVFMYLTAAVIIILLIKALIHRKKENDKC